jgi:hypothetical protein
VLGKVCLRYYIYKLEICTVNVHGCDEMLADSLQFETMAYASAAMTGKLSFWFWVTAAILFYGATWERLHPCSFHSQIFLLSGPCNLVVFAVRCLMCGFCNCVLAVIGYFITLHVGN